MDEPERPTRRRTSAGRLRLLDAYMACALSDELHQARCLVDLGIGHQPTTTLEWAALAGDDAEVWAIDTDPDAVDAARRAGLRARCAGFELGLAGEVDICRIMNVLRSYTLDEAERAYEVLAPSMASGGLVVEGSCDARGDVLSALVLRRCDDEGLVPQRLVLATSFARGFAPMLFRDVLPRVFRRDVRPGRPIHDRLFSPWQDLWREVRAEGSSCGPEEAFRLSIEALAGGRYLAKGLADWSDSAGLCWQS